MTANTPYIRRHNEPVVVFSLKKGGSREHASTLAREHGWRLVNLHWTRGVMPTNLSVVGAVLDVYPSHPMVSYFQDLGVPVVLVGEHTVPDYEGIPCVVKDQDGAGALAAEHFAERGFKHLGYTGFSEWGGRKGLYDGFEARGTELGCDVHLHLLDMHTGMKSEEKQELRANEIMDWLREMPKPLGYLAYNDYMAGRISMYCGELGLAVPEEVAILGINNDLFTCEFCTTPLSSIDMNDTHVGEALRLLKRLIAGEPCPSGPILIPPKGIVTRQSTDVLAIAEPRVARAIRYAWDHLDEPITTEDVARDIDVPTSTLRRLFRIHLGRSFNAELRRKRLEYCCELLRSTDCSVEKITALVGFRSPSYLYQLFQNEFSTSPREYRGRHRKKADEEKN